MQKLSGSPSSSKPDFPNGQQLSQRDKILRLLLAGKGQWVALPRILELGIAQYSARVCELRRDGFRIENKVEVDPETGQRYSWFRLPVPSEPTHHPTQSKAKQISHLHRACQRDLERNAPLFAGVVSAGER